MNRLIVIAIAMFLLLNFNSYSNNGISLDSAGKLFIANPKMSVEERIAISQSVNGNSDKEYQVMPGTSETHTKYLICNDSKDFSEFTIYRESGIPRHGYVTNCSGDKYEVKYFDISVNNAYARKRVTMQQPKFSDNMAKFFINEPIIVRIMDISNGNIVLEKKVPATIPYDSVSVPELNPTFPGNSTIIYSEEESKYTWRTLYKYKEEDTVPVYFDELKKGIYFVAVFNETEEIMYCKTLYRDITLK